MERGGGVAFRQAPHQIDSLRFLGGGLIRSVRGTTGIWMEGRAGAPGYYSAYLEFEDGNARHDRLQRLRLLPRVGTAAVGDGGGCASGEPSPR